MLSLMDVYASAEASATLLAAAIAAIVAAATFVIGELLRVALAVRDRQLEALDKLLQEWEGVAAREAARRYPEWPRRTSEVVGISASASRFLAVSGRRDIPVVTLQFRMNDELIAERVPHRRQTIAANATAAIVFRIRSRGRGRRHAIEMLHARGVTEMIGGHPVPRLRRWAKRGGIN
jgi:hypothetical protein